jgi:hypothetical protein
VLERCTPSGRTTGYVVMTLRYLGMLARTDGDYAAAADYFRESVILASQSIATGDYNEARGMGNLGRALFLKRDIEEAKRLDWLAAAVDRCDRPYAAVVLFGAAADHDYV